MPGNLGVTIISKGQVMIELQLAVFTYNHMPYYIMPRNEKYNGGRNRFFHVAPPQIKPGTG